MDDLFPVGQSQLGFDLGEGRSAVSYEPDRDEVRRELRDVLATAKAAQSHAPWDARILKYHKVVFHQMARWLPDEERIQLCCEFAREVERIESLTVAATQV